MKLFKWARIALFIGGLLSGLAIVPLWLSTIFLPNSIPTLFSLGFFLLLPIGMFVLGLGVIMLLIALVIR